MLMRPKAVKNELPVEHPEQVDPDFRDAYLQGSSCRCLSWSGSKQAICISQLLTRAACDYS